MLVSSKQILYFREACGLNVFEWESLFFFPPATCAESRAWQNLVQAPWGWVSEGEISYPCASCVLPFEAEMKISIVSYKQDLPLIGLQKYFKLCTQPAAPGTDTGSVGSLAVGVKVNLGSKNRAETFLPLGKPGCVLGGTWTDCSLLAWCIAVALWLEGKGEWNSSSRACHPALIPGAGATRHGAAGVVGTGGIFSAGGLRWPVPPSVRDQVTSCSCTIRICLGTIPTCLL